MPCYILVSQDNIEYKVDENVAKMSMTLKTMLEDLGFNSEAINEEKIPLPNVLGCVLQKVIEWCTHHQRDPPVGEEDDNEVRRTDNISGWDLDFLKVEWAELQQLMLAANYLDIKGLLQLTCKTIANMLKGKTPEEIRRTFGLKDDLTAEEKEQIRRENMWCEEK